MIVQKDDMAVQIGKAKQRLPVAIGGSQFHTDAPEPDLADFKIR